MHNTPPTPERSIRPPLTRSAAGQHPRFHHAITRTALVIALGLGLAVGPAPARSADPASGTSDAGTSRGKSRTSTARNTRDTPSTESRAERDRRLLRECRGRPNAGACLGYAS